MPNRIDDPLADIQDSSAGEEASPDEEGDANGGQESAEAGHEKAGADHRQRQHRRAREGRNYFKDSKTRLTSDETYKAPSLDDPAILAGLRKASALGALEKSEEEQKAAEREARLKKLLQNSSRDDEDLDLGFGTNRVEDEADLEDAKVKLSAWGEEEDEEGRGRRRRRQVKEETWWKEEKRG